MSKQLAKVVNVPALTKAMFDITTEDGKNVVKMSADFKADAIGAAQATGKIRADYTPIAVNLYQAFQLAKDKGFTWLLFARLFDETIPTSYPKSGTPERKALNANVINNQLRYLVYDVGRYVVDPPKAPDKEKAKANQKTKAANFAEAVKRYKLSASAVAGILRALGFLTKDENELNKTAKALVAAVGDDFAADVTRAVKPRTIKAKSDDKKPATKK